MRIRSSAIAITLSAITVGGCPPLGSRLDVQQLDPQRRYVFHLQAAYFRRGTLGALPCSLQLWSEEFGEPDARVRVSDYPGQYEAATAREFPSEVLERLYNSYSYTCRGQPGRKAFKSWRDDTDFLSLTAWVYDEQVHFRTPSSYVVKLSGCQRLHYSAFHDVVAVVEQDRVVGACLERTLERPGLSAGRNVGQLAPGPAAQPR